MIKYLALALLVSGCSVTLGPAPVRDIASSHSPTQVIRDTRGVTQAVIRDGRVMDTRGVTQGYISR